MKVSNAREVFFDSKEQFQQFRQSWKDFHKDGKHLKVTKKTWDGHSYTESNLHCEHHLIYALLRGKDISKMFVANSKIEGQSPYHAFYAAKSIIVSAANTQYPERYTYLLTPFLGTVNMDLLKAVATEVSEMRL